LLKVNHRSPNRFPAGFSRYGGRMVAIQPKGQPDPRAGGASAPDQQANARSRGASGRRWLRASGWLAVVLAVAGGVWFVAGFLSFTRQIAAVEPNSAPRADGIVVVTGGAQRLADALDLLARQHGRRLLISGVHARTSRDEIARHAGVSTSLLECCVDLGKSARNTIGNAIEARRWAVENGFRTLLVVTSNYHLPRTLEEFGHAMGGIRLIGHPVVNESVEIDRFWSDPGTLRLVLSEYVKYAVARARHAVEVDPETSRWPILVGRQKPLGPQPIERAGPGPS
jgi:uncharacterized SAM-binding protein YcdF (DUF218 family)